MNEKEIREYCEKSLEEIKSGANGLKLSIWAVQSKKFYESVIYFVNKKNEKE